LRETSHNQERSIRRKKGGKVKEKGEVKSNRKGTRKEEVEVVNWKRHEKVTLEKRDNGRRRKPTGTKICRKTRIIWKNKTKATNLWTIIQMEEKRRLELFRKAKQIIELLERETKTYKQSTTHLPIPPQMLPTTSTKKLKIKCVCARKDGVKNKCQLKNKHTERTKKVITKGKKKRMLRSESDFSVREKKRSAMKSGVVDQLQTDDSRKRMVLGETVEMLRSGDGADSGVVNQLHPDEIEENPKTMESGVLEQAQMDENVGGANSSEQIRNFLATSDSMVEGVVPITITPMGDPEEDQIETLMRLLEGSEEPIREYRKMRTKITVPSYEERQRMRIASMPQTRKIVKEPRRKANQRPTIERPYVFPPFDGNPKNKLSEDDERWDRINSLFRIPISYQSRDTRTSHTFVDMDYNYHQVHLDIPRLINNLKKEEEARNKLTTEQREAQKKWFQDMLTGNTASARRAKEKEARAKEEAKRPTTPTSEVSDQPENPGWEDEDGSFAPALDLVHGDREEYTGEEVDACEDNYRRCCVDEHGDWYESEVVNHEELQQDDLCDGGDAVEMGEVYESILGDALKIVSRVELSDLEKSIVDLISPDYSGDYSVPRCEWLSEQPNATVAKVLLAIGGHQSRKASIVVKARVEGKSKSLIRREERSLTKKKSDMKKKRTKSREKRKSMKADNNNKQLVGYSVNSEEVTRVKIWWDSGNGEMRQIEVEANETSDQLAKRLLNIRVSVYMKVNDKLWHPRVTVTELGILKNDIVRVHYRGLGGMMAPNTKESVGDETDSPEESEADWMIASQLADVWGESELTESPTQTATQGAVGGEDESKNSGGEMEEEAASEDQILTKLDLIHEQSRTIHAFAKEASWIAVGVVTCSEIEEIRTLVSGLASAGYRINVPEFIDKLMVEGEWDTTYYQRVGKREKNLSILYIPLEEKQQFVLIPDPAKLCLFNQLGIQIRKNFAAHVKVQPVCDPRYPQYTIMTLTGLTSEMNLLDQMFHVYMIIARTFSEEVAKLMTVYVSTRPVQTWENGVRVMVKSTTADIIINKGKDEFISTVTLANLRKMLMTKQWTRTDGMGVKGLRQGPYLFLIPEHVNRTIEESVQQQNSLPLVTISGIPLNFLDPKLMAFITRTAKVLKDRRIFSVHISSFKARFDKSTMEEQTHLVSFTMLGNMVTVEEQFHIDIIKNELLQRYAVIKFPALHERGNVSEIKSRNEKNRSQNRDNARTAAGEKRFPANQSSGQNRGNQYPKPTAVVWRGSNPAPVIQTTMMKTTDTSMEVLKEQMSSMIMTEMVKHSRNTEARISKVEQCVGELATKVVKIDDFLAYSQGTKEHMNQMMKMMQRMEATIVSQGSTQGGQKRPIGVMNEEGNGDDDMETEGNSTSSDRRNG
jgi:hypothetical protein